MQKVFFLFFIGQFTFHQRSNEATKQHLDFLIFTKIAY